MVGIAADSQDLACQTEIPVRTDLHIDAAVSDWALERAVVHIHEQVQTNCSSLVNYGRVGSMAYDESAETGSGLGNVESAAAVAVAYAVDYDSFGGCCAVGK